MVWNRLLPAVGDDTLIPGKDYKRLLKKQSSYQLPFVPGKASSSLARDYAGKSIVLEPNKFDWQSLDLQFKQKEVIMTVTETDGRNIISHSVISNGKKLQPMSILPIR